MCIRDRFRLFEPGRYFFLQLFLRQFLARQGFQVLFRVSVKTGPDLFHGACRFRAFNYDDANTNFLKALETGSLLYVDLMYADNSVLKAVS